MTLKRKEYKGNAYNVPEILDDIVEKDGMLYVGIDLTDDGLIYTNGNRMILNYKQMLQLKNVIDGFCERYNNTNLNNDADNYNNNYLVSNIKEQLGETELSSISKQKQKEKKENEKGIIYIMKNMGCYKIGKAKIGSSRFGEYTKLPEDPEYIVKSVVKNYSNVELMLHDLFKDRRLREGNCEWFNLTERDIEQAKSILLKYKVA